MNHRIPVLPWLLISAAFLAPLLPLRSDERFVVQHPAPSIYHPGWIDLNKNGVEDPYENPALEVEARITDLIGRMTLEEKTAQMVTLYGYPRVLMDELPTPAWKQAMWKDGIGNIDEHMNGETQKHLPLPHYQLPWSLHARALNDVQRFFIETTRLGVPADFTNEGIRGLLHAKATSYPSELGLASAFDVGLVSSVGHVTGSEARVLGYTNVYSPVLDLARDPRWGRTVETYGEDPFLVSALGMAEVRAIQAERVVSTLKHFAVYSIPSGGRDGDARTDPQATWREVQTVYLEPFRHAVRDAHALGVMASYNDYNGIPIEANPLFLTDLLRHEWGFQGYVVSDSAAVEFIHAKHRVAPTAADAIRQAVEAGLNVRTHFTPPEEYVEPLRQLVRTGDLAMTTIDSRVRDILRVKYWQGRFDHPYLDLPSEADRVVRSPEHLASAARAARESIVLLKNDASTLPLRKDLKRILVAGPLADDPQAWWSRYGPQQLDFITPLAGIRAKLGQQVDVRYAKGVDVIDEHYPASDIDRDPPSAQVQAGIAAAVAAATDVDAIVAVLGETDELCRESDSRISLNLPGYQENLLEALAATGKPLVLVLANGRPLSVNWAARHVPSIVEIWFPGDQGGNGLADVLFGDYNPSGRLPITIPRSAGQIPMNFPFHPGAHGEDHGQLTGPLYPFGYGLSYTSYRYSHLRISPEAQGPGGNVVVTCDVTNSGSRDGDAVVQLYLREDYADVVTFDKELKGFARTTLAPGETKSVSFTLTAAELQTFDRNDHWRVEPGTFTVMVGESSVDERLTGHFAIRAAAGSKSG